MGGPRHHPLYRPLYRPLYVRHLLMRPRSASAGSSLGGPLRRGAPIRDPQRALPLTPMMAGQFAPEVHDMRGWPASLGSWPPKCGRPTNKERIQMLLTATPPTTSPGSFESLVDTAMRGRRPQSERHYALDHGVDEPALSRYASGAVSVYERYEIECVIAKCVWARNYVVDLVRDSRRVRNAA